MSRIFRKLLINQSSSQSLDSGAVTLTEYAGCIKVNGKISPWAMQKLSSMLLIHTVSLGPHGLGDQVQRTVSIKSAKM